MLLKYRKLARPGRLAAELVELSKSIRTLQTLLADSNLTRFIVVSRAAELPRLESVRLLRELRRFGVGVPFLIVNAMTLNPGRCPRCRRTSVVEAREAARLARACRRVFPDCAIIQTPLVAPPPRGVEPLERWARLWMS
jgi:anion-transporting  ArsA/GET3 family ATPase